MNCLNRFPGISKEEVTYCLEQHWQTFQNSSDCYFVLLCWLFIYVFGLLRPNAKTDCRLLETINCFSSTRAVVFMSEHVHWLSDFFIVLTHLTLDDLNQFWNNHSRRRFSEPIINLNFDRWPCEITLHKTLDFCVTRIMTNWARVRNELRKAWLRIRSTFVLGYAYHLLAFFHFI